MENYSDGATVVHLGECFKGRTMLSLGDGGVAVIPGSLSPEFSRKSIGPAVMIGLSPILLMRSIYDNQSETA